MLLVYGFTMVGIVLGFIGNDYVQEIKDNAIRQASDHVLRGRK